MRVIVKALVCAGVSLTVAACDPSTDRRYFTEGAGVDLYTADGAQQAVLLDQYVDYICEQAGGCGGNWSTFVMAGMNDIDQRCDGFLTWLDARRRDREPILAQLSAMNTATHTIMTVTGANPTSLAIATAAFGLASATYSNWNSRLLISVNQSTVQEVVYRGQGDYREKLKGYVVADRPTAIYLLRNYLRLCMPTTIEASINTTTTLVLNDAPRAARSNLVVATTTARPAVIRDVNAPLPRFNPPPAVVSETRIGAFEQRMSQKDMKTAVDILGCTGSDLGPPGSPARRTLTKFLTDNGKPTSDRITNAVFFDLRDLKAEGKQGACSG
jgi:hypothetical protein